MQLLNIKGHLVRKTVKTLTNQLQLKKEIDKIEIYIKP